MDELSQYNVLKENVRAKLTKKPSQPNIEKIKDKKRCPKRDGDRISKKINAPAASSN